MTFWEFVEHDASRSLPRAHELGGSLRELHAALADFPGELGQLSEVRDWLDRLLAELHPSPMLTPQDRDSLRSHLQELTPSVFESSLPAQAIHGDASISNLLRTDNGLIWSDLEDACVGPVHWDVAGLIIEARSLGGSEAFVADCVLAGHRIGERDRPCRGQGTRGTGLLSHVAQDARPLPGTLGVQHTLGRIASALEKQKWLPRCNLRRAAAVRDVPSISEANPRGSTCSR